MTGQPRIAIPEPTSGDAAYNQRGWPEYAHAIEASGGMAVKIPLHAAPAEVARLASSCSAILLPGSPADVHPQRYGQLAESYTSPPDPAREAVDELLLQDAFNLHKPTLGICYGHQSLNVWKGGALVQHLQTAVNHKPGREVENAHFIDIATPFSELANILDKALCVNSSHHQAVAVPGGGLVVAARCSEDAVIEAVEGIGPDFVMGVQWHPERTFDVNAGSKALFAAFVAAASDWHPREIQESVAR